MPTVNFRNPLTIIHDSKEYLMLELDSEEDKRTARKFATETPKKLLSAVLDVFRKKRSNNANAKAWVLMGKLATKLNISTTEIYRQYIREIGDNFEIVPVRDEAVDKMMAVWRSRGLGWVCDNLGRDMTPGYQSIALYYGSSVYDSMQMYTLLKLIVQDCEIQGIETLSPKEIEQLREDWEERNREWVEEYGTS
jgi:hypothetical protein